MASVAVAAPGKSGKSYSRAASIRLCVAPGETPKVAPADFASRICAAVSRVPTPAMAPSTSETATIASIAAAVRSVISKAGRPPATRARARGWASSTRSMVKTGITGAAVQTFAIISVCVIFLFLNYNAGALRRCAGCAPEDREQFASHANFIVAEVWFGRDPLLPILSQCLQSPRNSVQAQHIAIFNLGNRSAIGSLRRQVNGRRNLARSTRHAPICDQGDLMSPVLQDGQEGREIVQFWHAIG